VWRKSRFAKILEGSQGFARVRKGSQGFARVRKGSQGFARVRKGSQGFAWVRGVLRGFVEIREGFIGEVNREKENTLPLPKNRDVTQLDLNDHTRTQQRMRRATDSMNDIITTACHGGIDPLNISLSC
jgi:hypothetical protein